MESFAEQAINAVSKGQLSFCKFLSANDTGLTGGHQAGIYISKPNYQNTIHIHPPYPNN